MGCENLLDDFSRSGFSSRPNDFQKNCAIVLTGTAERNVHETHMTTSSENGEMGSRVRIEGKCRVRSSLRRIC